MYFKRSPFKGGRVWAFYGGKPFHHSPFKTCCGMYKCLLNGIYAYHFITLITYYHIVYQQKNNFKFKKYEMCLSFNDFNKIIFIIFLSKHLISKDRSDFNKL